MPDPFESSLAIILGRYMAQGIFESLPRFDRLLPALAADIKKQLVKENPPEELTHLQKHNLLHQALNELVADFMLHTHQIPSETTVMKLMQWSFDQTQSPTEET